MARIVALTAGLLALGRVRALQTAGICGGYPKTKCQRDHTCCAIDSGDEAGFCCPKLSWRNETIQCAWGVDGVGLGILPVRNCCEGQPVCGVGVGAHYCCMGPRSKWTSNGCAAFGPPMCCNTMCGDDLCDVECKWVGGTCTPGNSSAGGKCSNTTTGEPIAPPPMV